MWLWKLNSRRMLLTKVLFVLFNQLMVIGIYGKLCETETGQNNIILDIEESRGDGEFHNFFFPFSSAASHRIAQDVTLTHTALAADVHFRNSRIFFIARHLIFTTSKSERRGAAINNEPKIFFHAESCSRRESDGKMVNFNLSLGP
jgi:hypothetical protein